jgi:predicted signal transduction protein with EAL and GGDEF domain
MRLVNMKLGLAAVERLLRVPADNPELMRAQFDAFSKQIPLLYFILIINSFAVAYTFVPLAPTWLTMAVPTLLCAVAAFRIVWWLRQRHPVLSDAEVLRHLRLTNLIAGPIGALFACWFSRCFPMAIPSPKARSRSTWP